MNNTMSLQLRTTLLAVILTAVVIIEGGFLFYANSTIIAQANLIKEAELPILKKSLQLKLTVVQVQQWLTDISATRGLDGLDDGFDEAQKQAKMFTSLIGELKSLDSQQAGKYGEIARSFEAYYQSGKQMAQAYVDGGPAAGNAMMADFDSAAELLNKQITPFLMRAQTSAEGAIEQQHDAARLSEYFVIFGSLVIVISLVIVTLMTTKAIAGLPAIVAKMADGDLSTTFDTSGKDEVSEIMRSLQSMRSRLLVMVTSISDTTNELSQTSGEMATLSVSTNRNIQQQFSETEQVATAINEMTITAAEVANTIEQTSEAAQQANSETAKGAVVVSDAIKQIDVLAEQVDEAAETVHQLELDCEKIATVLEVIKSIAEQTNLLALNAAIEAARAGEQGRGFAVVADEVRTLAGRTAQSTGEINQMLDKLLSGSREAVDMMGKSKHQVSSTVSKISDAGQSLTTISGVVEKIVDMSIQIANASEEQSVVAEEINQNIVHINDMSNESVSNVEQAAGVSKNIARISGELKTIVDQFKV
ncbi:MAG: methyl-accepting chemotaxis protein [Phenylobacterium sp.]|jgi:methyl-accepting chemotaxis protein